MVADVDLRCVSFLVCSPPVRSQAWLQRGVSTAGRHCRALSLAKAKLHALEAAAAVEPRLPPSRSSAARRPPLVPWRTLLTRLFEVLGSDDAPTQQQPASASVGAGILVDELLDQLQRCVAIFCAPIRIFITRKEAATEIPLRVHSFYLRNGSFSAGWPGCTRCVACLVVCLFGCFWLRANHVTEPSDVASR